MNAIADRTGFTALKAAFASLTGRAGLGGSGHGGSGLSGAVPSSSAAGLPQTELPLPGKLTLSSLADIVDRLGQIDPAALSQGRAPLIPQPGAQLTASLLFFIAALRGGSPRSWVGERGAAALEAAGSGDILGRVSAEFGGASRAFNEPPPGDWRSLTLPFQHEQKLSEILLHYNHGGEQSGDEESDEDGGKRIMVDFSLTRSGPMRLDGLLRAKRFDLIVRSLSEMPDWMRTEVTQLFTSACEATGLAGSVSFRTGRQGWVSVAASQTGDRPVSKLA